ncbi:MAG TPA: hypothetical protein VGB98_16030 [Pyrinomonadaceae bacterium]
MFDASTLIVGATGAAMLGLGLGTAYRITGSIVGELRASRSMPLGLPARLAGGEGEEEESERVQLRETSIAGLLGNPTGVVRHKDGSYTAAFHVALDATMLADDEHAEERALRFARILAHEKPPGTVIQYRHRTGVDPGIAIAALEMSQADEVNELARQLADLNLSFHRGAAAAGAYRLDVATFWIRIPSKHRNDFKNNSALGHVAEVLSDIRRQGARNFISAVVQGYREIDNGLVRRMIEDELECLSEAEKFFEHFAENCPLRLRRFTRKELERALYYGHNFDAESCPTFPNQDGVDLSGLLCGETIKGSQWFIMHGSRPVTMVSMITPPNPRVSPTTVRRLSVKGDLNFDHNTVVEYITLKKEKAVKKIKEEIKRTHRSANKASGGKEYSHESLKKLADCNNLAESLTANEERMVAMRCYAVIYGDPAHTQAELERSVKKLEKNRDALLAAWRELRGAEVRAEEPAALRALYRKTIICEFDAKPTGREIEETTDTLSVMMPVEDAWQGAERAHTILPTVTGRLRGIDLAADNLGSKVIVFLGAQRSGKSSLMAQFALDILARKKKARVFATDYGLSLEGLCRMLHGHLHRFNPDVIKPLNILDYPGLGEGKEPDERQTTLIVEFYKRLLRVAPTDEVAESILFQCVKALCRRMAANNTPDEEDKYEPTLSGLVSMLDTFNFEGELFARRAQELKGVLEKHAGHPWLDARTHADYKTPTTFTVFELKDLEHFPEDVRNALAYTIMARITSAIGELDEDKQRHVTVGLFDEIWRYRRAFPIILEALKIGARTGGKENFITMLGTHGYEDLAELYDITKTAGVRVIGKMSGDISLITSEARLSPEAVAAIKSINNVTGSHRQYVVAMDYEDGQVVEMFENHMSSVLYWTQTNNANERNAKERLLKLLPGWTYEEAIIWLAATYPRGLAHAGLVELDERLLPVGTNDFEEVLAR